MQILLKKISQNAFRKLSFLGCLLLPVLVLLIGYFLFHESLPVWKNNGFELITSTNWDPNNNHFGGLTALLGTLVSSLIALFIAIPLSLLAACFLAPLKTAEI